MLDVILDTLLDVIKLLPFLFVSFLILELLEHKMNNKLKNIISSSGKFGPLIGSLFGAIPQCGFSVLATNFYVTRIISMGTLIAIYLSTSDEMLPILIANNAPITEIGKIIAIKVLVGIVIGFLIDLLIKKKSNEHFDICEDEHCDCNHSLIKSTFKHTFKTLLFIAIITLIINTIFYYLDESIIKDLFVSNFIITSFIAPLFGLIPNCASSIILTELYLNGILTLGSSIGGLLTGSGVATLVLFKNNKNLKENILIVSIIYTVGVIAGIVLNLLGI